MNWKVEPFDNLVHVIPVDDLRHHNEEGVLCWCCPEQEDSIVIHHALDEREKYETGERKAS